MLMPHTLQTANSHNIIRTTIYNTGYKVRVQDKKAKAKVKPLAAMESSCASLGRYKTVQ